MDSADALTIILQLKGREHYTHRLFQYLEYIDCPYRIIIADGGSTDLSKVITNSKHIYFSLGPDSTPQAYLNKLRHAALMVDTPLVLLLDNDDFVNSSCFDAAIRFLAANSKYASYRDDIVHVDIAAKAARYRQSIYKKSSVVADTPSERLKTFYHQPDGAFHDMMRTEIFRAWMCSAAEIGDLNAMTTIGPILMALSGHMYRACTTPFILHQVNTPRIAGISWFKRGLEWPTAKGWGRAIAGLISICGLTLAELEGMPIQEAKGYVAEMVVGVEFRKLKLSRFIPQYVAGSAKFDEVMRPLVTGAWSDFLVDGELGAVYDYDAMQSIIGKFLRG